MIDQLTPWLGATPAHWEVAPLGRLVDLMGGATPSKEQPRFWDGAIPWVSPKDMKQELIGDSIDRVSADALANSALRMVPTSAVLIVVRGMILAHSVPVGLTTAPVTLNQDMKALLPRPGVVPAFLAWSLRAFRAGLLAIVEDAGHGTKKLRTDLFTKLLLPVPAEGDQRTIADFLDRKTAAIDALIEKKLKLLDLLAEKRAALINQAVTKGLDPNVPMKDSGIPWIGEIPAHWEMHRLRRVVRRFIDYRGRTPEKSEDGIPLITAGAVRDGRVDHGRAPEWVSAEVHAHLVKRGRPEVGDLLFTSEAPLGEVGLIEDPQVACAQRIIMFKVEASRMDSAFLRLHFLSGSGRGEVWSRASGSTAAGIRADRLKMSLVATPPLPEQSAIAAFVARETHGFDETDATVQRQIARLSEYRQALITAAVTGQLDVTEAA